MKKLIKESGFKIRDSVGISISPLNLGEKTKFTSFSRIILFRCEKA